MNSEPVGVMSYFRRPVIPIHHMETNALTTRMLQLIHVPYHIYSFVLFQRSSDPNSPHGAPCLDLHVTVHTIYTPLSYFRPWLACYSPYHIYSFVLFQAPSDPNSPYGGPRLDCTHVTEVRNRCVITNSFCVPRIEFESTVNVVIFAGGKISRNCWQDISCGGNFHNTTPVSS